MNLSDCVVMVTGAASGLGAASARALERAGSKVVLCDLDEHGGAALARQIAGSLFVRTDVRDPASVQEAVASAVRTFGTLHVSVSCAGVLSGEKVLGRSGPHSLDRFRAVLETNLVGTFNVMRLSAEAMSKHPPNALGERGVIINTSSIAAFEGQVGQVAYAASKAGVAAMTLPAARDLATLGIRVCSIAPGLFDTAMLAGLPDAARHSLASQVPFPQRLGNPDEFASLVVEVIRNPMLNGTTIRLDGGLRMAAR